MPENEPTDSPDIEVFEANSAFSQAAGLQITEAGPTRVVGWIDLDERHHQPFGLVHGGVLASAVESAGSIGATTAVWDRGLMAVGVNNNTNFVSSMSAGRVNVVAEAIVQGRTQQLWNVEIRRDGDDRLVATGQLRLANVERRT